MESEVAVSSSTTDTETITLAELDAHMGVIPDPTGDYAAGRTVFFANRTVSFANTEEFLEALESRVRESA